MIGPLRANHGRRHRPSAAGRVDAQAIILQQPLDVADEILLALAVNRWFNVARAHSSLTASVLLVAIGSIGNPRALDGSAIHGHARYNLKQNAITNHPQPTLARMMYIVRIDSHTLRCEADAPQRGQ